MEFITYEQDGFVGVITINRPKALNALNSQVLDELDATLDSIDINTVRCVILTGAGEKSFVAGADIGEMSTLTKAEGEAFGKKGNDVFRKLETLPVPVIAAMTGIGKVSIIRNTSLPFLPNASPSAFVSVDISPISAPATNDFSPAPVKTSALVVSRSTALKVASSSSRT